MRAARKVVVHDFAWITDRYFYDFADRDLINTGWCYVWAWLAKLAVPEAQLVTYFDDRAPSAYLQHAFIRIGDLYFDSSQPLGTQVPEADLWFFQEYNRPAFCRRYLREMSPVEFRYWWGTGRDFETQKLDAWPATLPPRPDLEPVEEDS